MRARSARPLTVCPSFAPLRALTPPLALPLPTLWAVLTDVIRSLLTPDFLRDIFRPQNPHTYKSLRQVFSRLAHSSIMRLNESSMGKLYDLMIMAFKYQVLVCGHPSRAPLDVSFKHLGVLRGILSAKGSAGAAADKAPSAAAAAPPGAAPEGLGAVEAALAALASASASASGTVADLIDAVQRSLQAVYGDLPAGEQWALYSTLLNFFLERRVKVSALIGDGLQTADGALVLGCAGPLPRGAGAAVGVLRRFDLASGKCTATEALPALQAVHVQAARATAAAAGLGGRVDWRELGCNMYCETRWGGAKAAGAAGAGAGAAGGGGGAKGVPAAGSAAASAAAAAEAGSGRAGVDFLSSLLSGSGSGSEGDYNLNLDDLFAEEGASEWGSASTAGGGGSGGGGGGETEWDTWAQQKVEVVRIAAALSSSMRALSASVAADFAQGAGGGKEEEGGDSLLDLLDTL